MLNRKKQEREKFKSKYSRLFWAEAVYFFDKLNHSLFLGLFLIVFSFGCQPSEKKIEYRATIKQATGASLFLTDGKEIALIGVYIPRPDEENHLPFLYKNIKDLIEGQEVLVKLRVPKHPIAFPKVDLVEVFFEEKNLNQHLLKTGMAFFFEDYWNVEEKEIYRQLEQEARDKKLGLWKEKGKLIPLSVRKKNTRFAYHPESPKVKDLPEDQKVTYYTPLPYQDSSIMRAVFDDFSMERWLSEEEKKQIEKDKQTGWDQLREAINKKKEAET